MCERSLTESAAGSWVPSRRAAPASPGGGTFLKSLPRHLPLTSPFQTAASPSACPISMKTWCQAHPCG